MANTKSIAELERYQEYLQTKLEQLSYMSGKALYDKTGVASKAQEITNYMCAIHDKISLLENEIMIAYLSNTVSSNGEEMSVYQAITILNGYKKKKEIYKALQFDVFYMTRHGESSTVDMDAIGNMVMEIDGHIYNLCDKIQKAKEVSTVEIDMQDFIVE